LIAYFGTGMLGAGFVRKMLERGETVQVWNRTFEKARVLEADGAKAFQNAADAVRGADQLHITLSDDASVDAVLEPLAGVIDKKTIIVDHTTTAPTPTAERIKRWAGRGVTFVHAPVFMSPPQAREGTGTMLLSGDSAVRARVKPLLAPMTGKVVEFGDDPTRATAFKLLGNMISLFTITGLADGYRFASSLGISPTEAQTLFSEFTPAGQLTGRGKAMAQENFTPLWELSMARKDVRLMIEEAARHGETLAVLPQIASVFDTYVKAGHGNQDVGVVTLPKP
jgi:3-hydroxyisobutyrate dehydrogenase